MPQSFLEPACRADRLWNRPDRLALVAWAALFEGVPWPEQSLIIEDIKPRLTSN
jgi:hypothetical protein